MLPRSEKYPLVWSLGAQADVHPAATAVQFVNPCNSPKKFTELAPYKATAEALSSYVVAMSCARSHF